MITEIVNFNFIHRGFVVLIQDKNSDVWDEYIGAAHSEELGDALAMVIDRKAYVFNAKRETISSLVPHVCFPITKSKPFTWALVAHESLHVVHNMLEQKGIPLEGNEELICIMQEYVIEAIVRIFDKHNIPLHKFKNDEIISLINEINEGK